MLRASRGRRQHADAAKLVGRRATFGRARRCNDAKAAMDACFKLEKDEKRRANLAKARAFDERRRQKHGDDAVGRAPPAS